ncbi:MAG: phosphoribosylanthranilate isomerase [Rhodospirillaceae bacterium]|nr:phosphoribosylanthranilate isomerase [Rhodospirillaceae bacterium]
MAISVKICGINTLDAMKASIETGSSFVGLVFYPPSPRSVTVAEAINLAKIVPPTIKKVGLFVDVSDKILKNITDDVPLDILQLHGKEPPQRVKKIKQFTGLPVIKAIHIENSGDFCEIEKYAGVADKILFDTKVPKNSKNFLPGVNALAFDWKLFGNQPWKDHWMLSGGLNAKNISEAVNLTGANTVDISSGVEITPGQKDPKLIKEFLETVLALS